MLDKHVEGGEKDFEKPERVWGNSDEKSSGSSRVNVTENTHTTTTHANHLSKS